MKKLRKSLFLLLITSGSLLLTSCGLTTSRIELQNTKDENAKTQSQENNFIQKETLTTEKTGDLLDNSEAQISQKTNFDQKIDKKIEQKSNLLLIPKSNKKSKTVKKQILKNFNQNKNQNQQQQKQVLDPKNSNKTEIITKKQPELAVFANFSQKYLQLENDVKNFINTKLKELKHEFFRDQLNQVIDEVEYEKIRDQKNQNESFFKSSFEKLTKIFDEVKTNYKNSTDFSQIIEPKIQDEKPKEKDENSYPLGIEKYQDYQGNLNSNNSAKSFMNLIDPKDVRNFEYQGYNEQNRKKVADFTKKLIDESKPKTDEEKIKIIFDWIVKNVKYAWNLSRIPAVEPSAVLEELYAVCGGYSNLYKAMLGSIGIKNSIVIGWSKFGPHQWNLVFDSKTKEFFHSDPTWGQFRRNDAEFAKDHKAFKILDSFYSENGQTYEYNLGVSLVSANTTNVRPASEIKNKSKVVGISNDFLKKASTLYIGPNVSRIDYQSGTFNVKSIEVDPQNPYFASKNGVLYNKNLTKLIIMPEKYEFSSFVLPKTVQEIEDYKFSLNAKNLEKITVEPGNYYFRDYGGILYNNDLSKIIFIPKNYKGKIITAKNVKLDPHTFANNPKITEIEISQGVKEIPDFAFNSLSSLSIIKIPQSLEKFSENAFVAIGLRKIKIIYPPNIDKNVTNVLKKLKKMQ
ncbi:leucine-rich repeat protein [Mesomycoplasma ovipneumoniae]|uniref:Leucine-rich repeat protein n=1 Tax=Mesomycoplasma ovipneumoniae TaxID=29562 RepID=A0AAP6CUD0_9BACT|nr:leucine-rich repeat protein [Mesomycoplasma ovipneumoniae]MDW2916507.1 leucine-rich repeat protein [Mesomycoplasma ovipneumoniae]